MRILIADDDATSRLVLQRALTRLGYEVGSGVMVGIPGQSYATLARDIALATRQLSEHYLKTMEIVLQNAALAV